ncbi:MAG: class B sortase [Defluviitaleaceae bacterium]|nr:class B sortase [Defluviitaleaceae bacterium]
MYQYKRPVRPSKPKTPKLLYITLAVVLLISAGVIANYIHRDFMFRHGGSHPLLEEPPYEPYVPTPPTPEPTPTVEVVEHVEPEPYEPEPTPDPGPTPPPRVMRPEFLDYREQFGNDGIMARLWVPNTSINYLVPQTTDNVFYLYHDIWGRRSAPGWVWLCTFADLYGEDQNLVFFGHNMGRDHMFHAVRNFLREDFFFNNRYIYLSTIYADYVFEVFSVYITHISFPYIYSNYDHRYGGWEHYINAFAERSHFDAGITVSENDRIITLSTCENARRDYRIAVHGRLISETFPHLDSDNEIYTDIAYDENHAIEGAG